MKNNSKKSKYILLSLLFIFIGFILIAIGLLFKASQNSNKKDKKQEQIIEQEQIEGQRPLKYETISIETSKIKTITSEEKKLDLEFTNNEEYEDYFNININDNLIIQEIPKIYDNVTIYYYKDAFCLLFSNIEASNKIIYFINMDGEIIKTINFNRNNNINYSIKNSDYLNHKDAVTIDEKEITIVLSGTMNSEGIITANGISINVNEEKLEDYNLTETTPVEIAISFEYLGNNEFTEEKIIEQIEIKDLLTK